MKKIIKKSLSVTIVAAIILSVALFGFSGLLSSIKAEAVSDYNLSLSTRIFKETEGEWIAAEKVMPGDKVKARVYLGTDYYAGHAELLLFANKDSLVDDYPTSALLETVVNPDYAFQYEAVMVKTDSSNIHIKRLIDNGIITSDFASNHYAYIITISISNINYSCQLYDESLWITELDFTVGEGLYGDAALLIVPETLRSIENGYGKIDVPLGSSDVSPSYATSLASVEVNFTTSFDSLSTTNTVTLNANGGFFADGSSVKVQKANIGADLSELLNYAEIPVYEGYSFVGWDTDLAFVPEEDVEVFAIWEKNSYVLSFNANGGTFADGSNVALFEVGYGDSLGMVVPTTLVNGESAFLGWQTADGIKVDLDAMTMPASDLDLYAIWEAPKDVVYYVEVINAPEKAIYKSSLNLDGMKLKISGDDGSVYYITDTARMNISGFDSKKIGEQTVTVECDGYYAEFDVTVSYAWWQWIIRIFLLGFIWY